MPFRAFLASLLAAAIGLGFIKAGEPVSQSHEEKTVSLTDLAMRCRKMLDMQIAVYEGTKQLHQVIEATPAKKSRPKDQEIAVQLSVKQAAIIAEAAAVLDKLNKDGVAVAFTEFFEELRGEMKRVKARLEKGDVGLANQTDQKELIDRLKGIVEVTRPL